MSRGVDVLAVLSEQIEASRSSIPLFPEVIHQKLKDAIEEVEAVRAVVAELIEAATVLDERVSYYNTVSKSVSKSIETWNAEDMRRYRAALARVRGVA